MHDDFSALDLLSCGGFRLSAAPAEAPTGKKRHFLQNRKPTSTGKRRLAFLLPLLGGKIRRRVDARNLQGWPVPLSWPTKDIASRDTWMD
jgi:hypothetical protein